MTSSETSAGNPPSAPLSERRTSALGPRQAKIRAGREPQPRHWTRRQIVIATVLWVVGAVVLSVMSVFAHQYREFPFDISIEEWVQQLLRYPLLVRVVNFASDANWPIPAGVAVTVVTVGLALLRRYREAIASAIAGFGAANISFLINGLVARPRPAGGGIHAIANVGLHSYPSGHVSQVVSFYGFLLYLTILEGRTHPSWRRWLVIPQVISAYFLIFIGPSRVLEGEHWPSDVVAGYLVGALWLVVVIGLYHWMGLWWQRYQRRRQVAPASRRA